MAIGNLNEQQKMNNLLSLNSNNIAKKDFKTLDNKNTPLIENVESLNQIKIVKTENTLDIAEIVDFLKSEEI